MRNITKFLVVAALVFGFVYADCAHAEGNRKPLRAGSAAGTYTNRAGQTGTWQKNVERGNGTVNKNLKWNNPQGGQGASQVQRSWDRSTGTGSSTRTTTNAQGQTATTNKTYTKNEDGSRTVQTTRTGFNGKTTTSDKVYTRNPDGTISINKTVTGPNGGTVNTNSVVTKTDDGWTRQGTYTDSRGGYGTYTQTGTKTDDGHTVDTTVTNGQGQTWNRSADYTHDGEGNFGKAVTQTNPRGETRSWWSGITIEQGGHTND